MAPINRKQLREAFADFDQTLVDRELHCDIWVHPTCYTVMGLPDSVHSDDHAPLGPIIEVAWLTGVNFGLPPDWLGDLYRLCPREIWRDGRRVLIDEIHGVAATINLTKPVVILSISLLKTSYGFGLEDSIPTMAHASGFDTACEVLALYDRGFPDDPLTDEHRLALVALLEDVTAN